jgi:hypothetical protein
VAVSRTETAAFELDDLLRTWGELSPSERSRFMSWLLALHDVSAKGLTRKGVFILKRTAVLLLCLFAGSQVRSIVALEALRRLHKESPDLPTATAALQAEIAKGGLRLGPIP